MTDKERILINIIRNLYSTQLTLAITHWKDEKFYKDKVYFDYWNEPKKGDLVLTLSGSINEWTIGFYEEYLGYDEALIREIGTNNICRYGNESFIPIKGLNSISLLERDKYKFYIKVLKAFGREDSYKYRFGGLDFKENNEVVIWVREVFGGMIKKTKPFDINMVWNKKISIKRILEIMKNNGYGTKPFEGKN